MLVAISQELQQMKSHLVLIFQNLSDLEKSI